MPRVEIYAIKRYANSPVPVRLARTVTEIFSVAESAFLFIKAHKKYLKRSTQSIARQPFRRHSLYYCLRMYTKIAPWMKNRVTFILLPRFTTMDGSP